MKVMMCPPLDFFVDCTVAVTDWFSTAEDPIWAWNFFLEACKVLTKCDFFDCKLRNEPRVAYDATIDSAYFIFKINNNGTTFLVGNFLPEVEGGEVTTDQ